MTVYIRHMDKRIAVDVAPNATVSDLINAAKAVGLLFSALAFAGQPLDGQKQPLSDLGIGAEAEVTAFIPSPFENHDDFTINDTKATLKSKWGRICFTHRTSIGQETKMTLKIANNASRAQLQVKVPDLPHISAVQPANDGNNIIIMNAKQQGKLTVQFEGPDGTVQGYPLNPLFQYQVCVEVEPSPGIRTTHPTVEFVDFQFV